MQYILNFFTSLSIITIMKILFIDTAFLLFMIARMGMMFKKNYKADIFSFTAFDLFLTFVAIALFIIMVYAYYHNVNTISFSSPPNSGLFDYGNY